MKCDTCHEAIEPGEQREFKGKTLCEDCHMIALSPPKACDPWAVYNAKSFSNDEVVNLHLTDRQSGILNMLKETGGSEPHAIGQALGISEPDIDQEIATLRHMEKVSGELRDGKKIIRLWNL